MQPNERKTELAAFSYLWTSGAWTLHKTRHSRCRAVAVFAENRPTNPELLALRSLVTRFTFTPIAQFKANVGNARELDIGEFPSIETRQLEIKARAKGLHLRFEDTSYTSFLPVRADGMVLIIEDNELAQLITREMERQGVPIVCAECD